MRIKLKLVSVEHMTATFHVIAGQNQYTFKVTLQEPYTGLTVLQEFMSFKITELIQQLHMQQNSSNTIENLSDNTKI